MANCDFVFFVVFRDQKNAKRKLLSASFLATNVLKALFRNDLSKVCKHRGRLKRDTVRRNIRASKL